jgi:hypothetical protein
MWYSKYRKSERRKITLFEIYAKESRVVSAAPLMTIGKKLGRCLMNRAAALLLERDGVDYVLIMWDKETHRIGLKASTKKDPRSFAVRYSRKDKNVTGAAFSGVMFLRHIGYDLSTTQSYAMNWNADDSIFEVEIPPARLKGSQQSLLTVAGGKKHGKAAG